MNKNTIQCYRNQHKHSVSYIQMSLDIGLKGPEGPKCLFQHLQQDSSAI